MECSAIKNLITMDDEYLEMSSTMFYKRQWAGPNWWLDGSSGGGLGCLRTAGDRARWGVFSVSHLGKDSMLSCPSILADSNHSNAFKRMFS